MAIIPIRVHAILDYVVGVVLIVAPYLLGFADGDAAQFVPQLIGVATLIASLLTRYDLGAIKLIPFRTHLILDMLMGIVLLVSPWLFGFADRIWWPHVLFGLIYIVVPLLSHRDAAVAHVHL